LDNNNSRLGGRRQPRRKEKKSHPGREQRSRISQQRIDSSNSTTLPPSRPLRQVSHDSILPLVILEQNDEEIEEGNIDESIIFDVSNKDLNKGMQGRENRNAISRRRRRDTPVGRPPRRLESIDDGLAPDDADFSCCSSIVEDSPDESCKRKTSARPELVLEMRSPQSVIWPDTNLTVSKTEREIPKRKTLTKSIPTPTMIDTEPPKSRRSNGAIVT